MGHEASLISIICDTPDEFRKTVRALIREGVDLIKLNNSGDSFCFPAWQRTTIQCAMRKCRRSRRLLSTWVGVLLPMLMLTLPFASA